jgi:hypothetical protein
LNEQLTAGNLEWVNNIIRHVGTEADLAEAADAIISCRDLGLSDAADAIIRYSGRRLHVDVMRIARRLIDAHDCGDAGTLLGYATDNSHPQA